MSEVSPFYLACRNGDLATVQHILPNMTGDEKNRVEPNGSTALHAASYFGHHVIVKLLLENGCATWIRNKYNNAPCDEAHDDEIRQLFRRPDRGNGSHRFASVEDCFSVVTRDVSGGSDEMEDDDNIPKGWVDGYKHIGTAKEREATVQQIVRAQMMKYCLKKFQVSDTCQDVFKLLKKTVPSSVSGEPDYDAAREHFDRFRKQQNVNDLVRLYTFETPFYDALQRNVDSYAIELYSRLASLQERAFTGGITYRGLSMTDEGINAYRWAAKNQGRMIEIKTMASTSQEKEIAIDFAKKSANKNKNHCVLFELEFSDICYTAIDLNVGEILTKYSYEKEVLLLPGTLFEVREVSKNDGSDGYTIRLENVPVPRKVLMKALDELRNA